MQPAITRQWTLTLLQPLRWCCVDCAIHHERDVREEQKYMYAWREQAIVREITTHDLYCCLLPQCEALRTCRSGFPIATTSMINCTSTTSLSMTSSKPQNCNTNLFRETEAWKRSGPLHCFVTFHEPQSVTNWTHVTLQVSLVKGRGHGWQSIPSYDLDFFFRIGQKFYERLNENRDVIRIIGVFVLKQTNNSKNATTKSCD